MTKIYLPTSLASGKSYADALRMVLHYTVRSSSLQSLKFSFAYLPSTNMAIARFVRLPTFRPGPEKQLFALGVVWHSSLNSILLV